MKPENEFAIQNLQRLIDYKGTGFETIELSRALIHIIKMLDELK